ncbi:MAG: NAD(P)/FAD-dependent oxidoreductase, partial [Gemmatimonadales bacterium]
MPDVDVVVIGAGPGGSVTAREAKRTAPALDVVLLERDRAVGVPVRCGEGVGEAGLREFVDPDGADWVSRKMRRVIFVAPDDTEVIVAERNFGYVLDRTRFDAFLAAEAAGDGVELLCGTEAVGLERSARGWRVRVRGVRGDEELDARVVIGADGVEAMVGRWAGLDLRVPARDMESC